MNKKFLSAILFGALMVTSTGTFVSCKDYDDDIDAINKELTDIKSQIAALQTKVENGNYVTNITKATNGINVTFSNGTTSFVETGAVVETEACYESAASIVDGEWVIAKADGTVVPTGIPASGVLVTGSEATGYVLSVVNAEGTVTEVKLPTAASTLQSAVAVQGATKFKSVAADAIVWATAGAKNDGWAGALGAIAKDQLLVGQIDVARVDVKPVTYDLGVQELTFVDNQGNVAPVVVTASPVGGSWIVGDSRAADKKGEWNLSIKMTADVKANNIAKIFAADTNGDGTVDYNKMYALAINGAVATDYAYQIHTNTTASTTGHTADVAKLMVGNKAYAAKMSLDVNKTHTLKYAYGSVADVYLSLSADQKVQAELIGVTVDGMNVTVPASAAAKEFAVTLNVLNVKGVASTATLTFKAGTSSVEASEIAATTYTLTAAPASSSDANRYMYVNVAEFFKTLTNAEVDAAATLVVSEVADQTNFLLEATEVAAPVYYSVKSDGKLNTTVTFEAGKASMTTIAYARYTVYNGTTNTDNVASDAKPGDYKLQLTLKSANGNEIKKAIVPVTIALPTFADLYVKSETADWNAETYSAKLLNNTTIDLANAFNAKTNYATSNLVIKTAKVDDYVPAGSWTGTTLTLDSDIVKSNAFRTTTLAAQASYEFYPTMKSATEAADYLVVKSEAFTIELHSQFEAPKLVYYVNGEAKEVAKVGEAGKIATLTKDDKGVKNGLAIQYARGEQAFEIGVTVDGVKLTKSDTDTDNKVQVITTIKDVASSSAVMNEGNVTVSETKGTLVAKFVDANGIVTKAEIAFE